MRFPFWLGKPIFAGALLVLATSVRSAETNPAPASLPATEFHLTSQPPAPENRQMRKMPPSAAQSNAIRVMQHRAALLNELRQKETTNHSIVLIQSSNRTVQLQQRRDALLKKKAEGTLTPGEQRQLQQLELLANRTSKTNPPLLSPTTTSPPAAADGKIAPR